MASVQAAQKVDKPQLIDPIELKYPNQGLPGGANWVLPTKEVPTAFLKDGFTIDVTGDAIRGVIPTFGIQVAFELSASSRSFGLKESDFKIGVKFFEEGEYEYQSVQAQIIELPLTGEKVWVNAYFTAKDTPGGRGAKTHFQLSETTAKVLKGGLTLHKARVEQFPN